MHCSQVRRAMEAENEKARRAAKREYNETVRGRADLHATCAHPSS